MCVSIHIYVCVCVYFVGGQEYSWNSTSIAYIKYIVNIADKHFEIISFHWIADTVLVRNALLFPSFQLWEQTRGIFPVTLIATKVDTPFLLPRPRGSWWKLTRPRKLLGKPRPLGAAGGFPRDPFCSQESSLGECPALFFSILRITFSRRVLDTNHHGPRKTDTQEATWSTTAKLSPELLLPLQRLHSQQ